MKQEAYEKALERERVTFYSIGSGAFIDQGWPEEEPEKQLDLLPGLERNFFDPPERLILERGWHPYSSESIIAEGRPVLPEKNGFFEWSRVAITNYEFSDPRVAIAHFNPDIQLQGWHMLLELLCRWCVR